MTGPKLNARISVCVEWGQHNPFLIYCRRCVWTLGTPVLKVGNAHFTVISDSLCAQEVWCGFCSYLGAKAPGRNNLMEAGV